MRKVDLAWAAGFVDGEGYVGMHGRSIALIIGQKHIEPLNHFVDIFSIGKVKRIPTKYKGEPVIYHRIDYHGESAIFILKLIMPYMVEKKGVAIEVLKSYEDAPNKRPAVRQNHRHQLVYVLNKKGYTFEEIGQNMGISRQRAHQLYKMALKNPPISDEQFSMFR